MRPIHDPDALRTATDDSLLHWAAQGMRTGVRAWSHGDAAAVAVSDVARRDRLAVSGPVTDVAAMVSTVLAEDGPALRAVVPG